MNHPKDFQTDPPRQPPLSNEARPERRFDENVDFRRPSAGEEVAQTIIPYRNPKALIAYYCGVFALIPCAGAALGPIALIFGILGLRYARAHPTAHGTGHAIAGIVLGVLTLLFNWGGVMLLAASMMMADMR